MRPRALDLHDAQMCWQVNRQPLSRRRRALKSRKRKVSVSTVMCFGTAKESHLQPPPIQCRRRCHGFVHYRVAAAVRLVRAAVTGNLKVVGALEYHWRFTTSHIRIECVRTELCRRLLLPALLGPPWIPRIPVITSRGPIGRLLLVCRLCLLRWLITTIRSAALVSARAAVR
jgi:hypothetical protein